jgi:hypothetical protein
MTRIWAAIVAFVTTVFLSTFVMPAAAWADQWGVVEELQRRRPRLGFGFASVLCCLAVVAGVVLAIVLINRRRQR